MLVYGDHHEFADPQECLRRIRRRISEVEPMAAGIERHAALVAALVEAGQLLQGVADADTARTPGRHSAATDELGMLLFDLACAVCRSWDGGFSVGRLPEAPQIGPLPEQVELRVPEGFAFYAVYPEAYIDAARRLTLSAAPCVVGIRSIGTTLGSVVAAAIDAPRPITVRPFGDPFARQVELPETLVHQQAHYIIVDEGPGLSGSSFGAVADWLEQRGVPLARIAFVAGHGGDLGPQSSAGHRERWRRAQRVAAEFDQGFLTAAVGPLEDISGGQWRRFRYASEADWPAAAPAWERRKFLAGPAGDRLLLKFAGLGAIGERKLAIARKLHAAGFTAEPIGLLHGFLMERWHEQVRPLAPDEVPLEEIGRYIGERARLLPAAGAAGATLHELSAMCVRNLSLALGEDPTPLLSRWDVRALERRARRVVTDNKLDRHEWLRLPDGRLLKTDALDHHQAHDLIGCQDVAWDVAGAIAEFGLDGAGAETLMAATRTAIDRDLLEFYRLAYCSFRLGQALLAADLVGQGSAEGQRLKASANAYAAQIRQLLHECSCGRLGTNPRSVEHRNDP